MTDETAPCHDCGAIVGQPHEVGCDIARCLWTGGQRLACEMGADFILDPEEGSDAVLITTGPPPAHDCGRDVWTGLWPGEMECREFGWYAYFTPNVGWTPCGPDHPGAQEDLNRLYRDARWDRDQKRWVLRAEPAREATVCETCNGPHDSDVHRETKIAEFQVVAAAADAAGLKAPWWWLSFIDPDRPKGTQFLGVSIVQCQVDALAPSEAWRQGCNPGGQVAIYPWRAKPIDGDPEGLRPPPVGDRNTLMTMDTLRERGYVR